MLVFWPKRNQWIKCSFYLYGQFLLFTSPAFQSQLNYWEESFLVFLVFRCFTLCKFCLQLYTFQCSWWLCKQPGWALRIAGGVCNRSSLADLPPDLLMQLAVVLLCSENPLWAQLQWTSRNFWGSTNLQALPQDYQMTAGWKYVMRSTGSLTKHP